MASGLRVLQRAFALLLLVLWVATPAASAPIAVPNASFEDPDVADGAIMNALNNDTSTVPGWRSIFGGAGVSAGGANDPDDAQYAGATGDGSALPAPADQGQALRLRGTTDGSTQSFTTTSPVATVEDETTYALAVAVGNPLDFEPGEVAVELIVDGAVVADGIAAVGSIPDGTFTIVQASFETGVGDPLTGGALSIRLRQLVGQNVDTRVHFDDVSLATSGPVPEPGAALSALLGLAVLVGARGVRARR